MNFKRKTSYDIKEDFIKNLLIDRNILPKEDSEYQHNYFYPTKELEHNPLLLKNIEKGFKLLERNLNNKILILVDADTDGFLSAALVWNYLTKLKEIKNFNLELEYLLPLAKEHGLETKIKYFLENKKCDLIIIPDSSSNDVNELEMLNEFGYDVIITDHHLYNPEVDIENVAIINNQDGQYPNRCLSGAGVAYKFIEYCDSKFGINLADNYLDLAAVAITADMMENNTLENRYIIENGLSCFRNFGLRALIRQQAYSLFSKRSEEITEDFLNKCKLSQIQISFYIAPLINALIRIGSDREKDILFNSFIDGDKLVESTKRGHNGEYETIAEQGARICLNAKNRQNKEKEKALELLDIQIINDCLDENKILILNADELDVSNSLTGLIAMGVAAKYKKPVILGRINSNDEFKGSIRGRGESELKDFRQFLLNSNLMEYVEGHPNAAGFGLKTSNISKLYDYANRELANIDFNEGFYEVDFVLNGNCSYLSKLIFDIDKNESIFGQGNDEPLILIQNIPVQNLRLVGANKNTINFNFNSIKYVKFKDDELADYLNNNNNVSVNIIGRAAINRWNEREEPQILINDIEIIEKNKYEF